MRGEDVEVRGGDGWIGSTLRDEAARTADADIGSATRKGPDRVVGVAHLDAERAVGHLCLDRRSERHERLRVEDFWWGVVAALIISIINWIFGIILRPQRKD